MRRQRPIAGRHRLPTRSTDARHVPLVLLTAVALVVPASSVAESNSNDAGRGSHEERGPDTQDGQEGRGIGSLVDQAGESTRWAVSCRGDHHCVYQRKIPVREARLDDVLILQLDLDSPGRPDLLVVVAPRRAKESAGIKIAFVAGDGQEDVELPPFTSFPLRCYGTGCGTALPLSTELNGGSMIGDRLASSRLLWVLYQLDGNPTRSLVDLEPLRSAIEETGRAGAIPDDLARERSRPIDPR